MYATMPDGTPSSAGSPDAFCVAMSAVVKTARSSAPFPMDESKNRLRMPSDLSGNACSVNGDETTGVFSYKDRVTGALLHCVKCSSSRTTITPGIAIRVHRSRVRIFLRARRS
jgi:hypothetical protein